MQRCYHVYVIRLLPSVKTEPRFVRANPDHDPKKPCAYVGSSVRAPEERLAQHVAGYKACRFVTLHHDPKYPLIGAKHRTFTTRDEATKYEARLARKLRERGWAIWQN